MIKIANLAVPLSYSEESLLKMTALKLGIPEEQILDLRIVNRAVDMKDKENVHFTMTVVVSVSGDSSKLYRAKRKQGITRELPQMPYESLCAEMSCRPVVVGSGPAGLFAALILAEAGVKPILLERGLDVDQRKASVLTFWESGQLDPKSNVQFGEGGAGTFSDGKLKTGKKDARKMKVLTELVAAGAPEEILYLSLPHIGTDKLHVTVKNLREKIVRLGGEVHFGAEVTELLIREGRVAGAVYVQDGRTETISTQTILLAIGHSARDTFEMLYSKGVRMEQKPFAVGVRIEHLQSTIDQIQYGASSGHPALGAASYRMVVHLPNGRAVYTFCMCPGGVVVAATSEEGAVVTNGMSEFSREGVNANTALLVTVALEDLGSKEPLAGIDYLRQIERAAFQAGGSNFSAPVQRLEDFMARRPSVALGSVKPTYLPGTAFGEVDSYLPKDLAESLREAIVEMGVWMPGFAHSDALLTGAETRSAAPIRMTRDENFEAIGILGLYPCGEGAGYSGGIISAAVDGVLCAENMLRQYAVCK